MKKKLALAVLLVAAALLVSRSLLNPETSRRPDSSLIVFADGVSLACYNDSSLANPVTAINWGSVSPGSNNTDSCVFYNNSPDTLTLDMNTSSWILDNWLGIQLPSNDSSYFTFAWNYSGDTLLSYALAPILFNLTVSPLITDVHTFAFNINVYGNATALPSTLSNPFFGVTLTLTSLGAGAVFWVYRRLQKIRNIKVRL